MAIELFGFTIGRTQKEKEQQEKVSFTLPVQDDGSLDIAGTPVPHTLPTLTWKVPQRMRLISSIGIVKCLSIQKQN